MLKIRVRVLLLLLATVCAACRPAPGASTGDAVPPSPTQQGASAEAPRAGDARSPAAPAGAGPTAAPSPAAEQPPPRASSGAASLVPVSLEQLSRQADLVVLATVRSLGPLQGTPVDARAKPVAAGGPAAGGPTPTPRPMPAGGDRYRDAVLAVDAVLKGERPDRDPAVRLGAFGEADLVPGERLVAFLAAGSGPYRVVGLAQGTYALSADGKSVRNEYGWPDGGGWVPLDDLARFVRAASAAPAVGASGGPPTAAGTPAATPAAFPRPTGLTVLRAPDVRIPVGPSAGRFGELADALTPFLGPGLRPSGLDVPPALAELHRGRGLAIELALPPGAATAAPGGPPAPDRLLVAASRYLSEDPLVFVGTAAGYGAEPLRSMDRAAAQRLAALLHEVSYVDDQGFVVGADGGGRELALLGERSGLLAGRLDEQTAVQGPLTRAGWPKASPGDVRVGWSVSFSGWPDPAAPGVVHVETLSLYGPGEFSRGRKRAQSEARPALVEHRGRLYAAETAAPAAIARFLEPTGERVAAGGRTTYGVGAELFRVKGDADGELLVLRLPGADDERRAASLRPRAFEPVAAADAFRPANPMEQPGELGPGAVPVQLEPTYRTVPPDAYRIAYRGRVFRPGPFAEGVQPGDLELVERIEANRPESAYGLVEVYRRKGQPADGALLLNVVPRAQLGEYQLWRVFEPAPGSPRG